MAKREWGFLCPEGHGILIEREGWKSLWCPHNDHGGNGRFYDPADPSVKEGYWDGTPTSTLTDAAIERLERAGRLAAEREELKREKEQRAMAKQTAKPKAAAKAKEPRDCLCGCGGQTKGGRFLPGHDARFHARVKTLTGQFGLDHDAAEKVASKGPLTGKYAGKPAAAKPSSNGTAKAKPAEAVEVTTEPVDDGAPIEV